MSSSQTSDVDIATALLGGRSTSKNSYRKLNSFNDPVFAILFMVNTIIVFGYAMVYGVIAVSGVTSQTVHVDSSGSHKSAVIGHFSTDFVGGLFLLCFVGSVMSISMVYAMSKFSSNIIITGLCIVALLSMVTALCMLAYGIVSGGVVLFAFSVFSGWFLYYIRPRVRFATVNLRIACEAISAMPRLYYYAGIVICIEFLWCMLWSMAAYGVTTNAADDIISHNGHMYNIGQCVTYVYGGSLHMNDAVYTCTSQHSNCKACFCESQFIALHSCYTEKFYPGYYILILISILWACSVFSNVIHCTSAGAVAMWWKTPVDVFDADIAPTISFITALFHDFGAICLGSLFVAVTKGLRNAVSFIIKQLSGESSGQSNGAVINRCLFTINTYILKGLDVLLGLLDASLEYFNRYAFTYVAMYGYNFTDASK